MHFQFIIPPQSPTLPQNTKPTPDGGNKTSELLRELIEIQKAQLTMMQHTKEQDNLHRWQSFLTRWSTDFPHVGEHCLQALPVLEKSFVQMVDELTQRIVEGEENLDNEFGLNDFLDRYGVRLSQLGSMLNILGPIADAARQNLMQPN